MVGIFDKHNHDVAHSTSWDDPPDAHDPPELDDNLCICDHGVNWHTRRSDESERACLLCNCYEYEEVKV